MYCASESFVLKLVDDITIKNFQYDLFLNVSSSFSSKQHSNSKNCLILKLLMMNFFCVKKDFHHKWWFNMMHLRVFSPDSLMIEVTLYYSSRQRKISIHYTKQQSGMSEYYSIDNNRQGFPECLLICLGNIKSTLKKACVSCKYFLYLRM